MATFVKTPTGTCKGIIRKRCWPTTIKTFRTKRDATDWARRAEDEMVRGVYIDRVDAERLTLEDALKRYLEEVAVTKRATTAYAEQNRAKRLQLRIRRRGAASSESLEVDRLIICTGIRLDYARSTQPLLQRLIQRQQLQADILGLGITTTPQGELVGGNGQVVSGVYTLGPPRRGELWESTVVPELRQQAQELANQILLSLHV